MWLKVGTMKKKSHTSDYIKIRNKYDKRHWILEGQPQTCKVLTLQLSTSNWQRKCSSYIKDYLSEEKMSNIWERTKRAINRKCFSSLVVKEMPVSTVRYHFTSSQVISGIGKHVEKTIYTLVKLKLHIT